MKFILAVIIALLGGCAIGDETYIDKRTRLYGPGAVCTCGHQHVREDCKDCPCTNFWRSDYLPRPADYPEVPE